MANQVRRAKSVAASSAMMSDFLCDCKASRTTATRSGFSVAGDKFSTLPTHTLCQSHHTYFIIDTDIYIHRQAMWASTL